MDKKISINDSLVALKGIGEKTAKTFENLGVTSIKDLIEYLPFRLEDRTNEREIVTLRYNEPSVISAVITNVSTRRSKKGRLIIQAKITDSSGSINALWFNQRYILKLLKLRRKITIYGEKRVSKPLGNPFFVNAIIDTPEILPVYRRSKTLTQYAIRTAIKNALVFAPNTPRFNLIKNCHLKPSEELLNRSWRLISYEEIYKYARKVYQQQSERKKIFRKSFEIKTEQLKNFSKKLGLELTKSQRITAWEIINDCRNNYPMRRLLYGEVGSGKTAVAQIVTANYVFNNKKIAILSPTVALADQTFGQFSKFFVDVALLTGKTKSDTTTSKIVIGTHALLFNKELLKRFDLIIVDEQQKFGVEDREKIISINKKVDLLMLSATPIPRTLAQTIFGNVDISYLLEKPAHQKPIISKIVLRDSYYEELQERLKNGEQGYVICPLINNENEELQGLFELNERKTVIQEAKKLGEIFSDVKVGYIHGKLSEKEKISTLNKFKNQEIQILVGTTVIEVGINSPNATWMVIENAESFGLSTLHQLRGRIGRGDKQSTCYFVSSKNDNDRLKAILNTSNGLELAQLDLELRGMGDLIGIEQSGKLQLKKSVWNNINFITKVFNDARNNIVGDDLAEI
ncbi:DEAD/DEAH box helicase [Candidatus Berkelbacteria bacterium]|nr:DEAD/DEAH box helicase [Candidatus Berkelbacteria bacterium]